MKATSIATFVGGESIAVETPSIRISAEFFDQELLQARVVGALVEFCATMVRDEQRYRTPAQPGR
jgi:hypothetical protein